MTHIAVVAPVYNEEQNVEEFTNRVSNELKQLTEEFKIILIDDGSKDSSWQKIAEICSKNRRVKGIKLSKNFGVAFFTVDLVSSGVKLGNSFNKLSLSIYIL